MSYNDWMELVDNILASLETNRNDMADFDFHAWYDEEY